MLERLEVRGQIAEVEISRCEFARLSSMLQASPIARSPWQLVSPLQSAL